jgi:hypothetical protein
MLIGGLMSISNLYVGLKTGWGLGVTITSCIIAYAVFEAVSKLSKGDHQAGDLQEGQEHLGLALVSDDQSAEVSEPGHGPFDRPSAAVAA